MLLKNSKETKRRKKCRKKVRTHKAHHASEASTTSIKHGANVGIGLGAIAAILSPTALSIVQAAEVPVTSETMTSETTTASTTSADSQTEIQIPVQGSESSQSREKEETPSTSESSIVEESQSSTEESSSSNVSSGSSSSTASSSSNSENHQATKPSTSTSTSQENQTPGKQPAASSASKPLEHYSPSGSSSKPLEGEQISGDGSISFSKNQTTAEFIAKIGEDARQIAGDNNLYASVMIAQAILESASGNSQLASEPNFNLFGIKGSYQGSSVEFSTQEDNGSGGMYSIQAGFRKYPSYKESLEDYVQLLRGGVGSTSDFYHGVWKSNTETYKDATQFLTGRYATDTQYHLKLNGLIETYDLTQYDHPKEVQDGEENVKVKKEKTYTISEKDTLWDIANNHHVSVPDLIKWNKLDSGLIHEGDTLIIGYEEVEMKKEEADKLPEGQTKVEAVKQDVAEQDVQVAQQNQKEATLSTISNIGNRLAKSISKLNQEDDVDTNYKLAAVQKADVALYQVQKDDTLNDIAKKTGIPAKQLKKWNHLDDKILSTGQYLRLSSPDYSLA